MTVFEDPDWVRRIIADQAVRDRIGRAIRGAELRHLPLLPEHRAQGGACQERGNCRWCEP